MRFNVSAGYQVYFIEIDFPFEVWNDTGELISFGKLMHTTPYALPN